MNTAGSVAYGWGVLIVAAGVSFYYAKKEIDVRRRDQQLRGARPTEKLSWEERIAQHNQSGSGRSTATNTVSNTLSTSRPGMHEKPTMESHATGVDATDSSAGTNQNR